jgi:hypothetical protein
LQLSGLPAEMKGNQMEEADIAVSFDKVIKILLIKYQRRLAVI